MGFFSQLRDRVRHARLRRFGDDEKRALVRLCYAVATADADVSDEELDVGRAIAKDLGVDFNDASKLALPEAVAILRAKPAHLELALLTVVDVIFADGDYDAGERDFVTSFAARHGLPTNTLQEAVERRARATADAALEQWHRDIVGAD